MKIAEVEAQVEDVKAKTAEKVAAFADSLTLGIWEFSENKELAKDFLKYHFEKSQFDQFLDVAVGYNVPFLMAYRNHPVFTSDPKIRFIGEIGQFEHPIGYPGPITANSQVVWDLYIIGNMFSYAATGQKSIPDSIAEISYPNFSYR